jgi:hypothetical protein
MLDRGSESALHLIVGDSHFELSELQGDRATFLRLKSLLDGRHSVTEISQTTGVPIADVRNLLSQFENLGLLRRHVSELSIQSADFLQSLQATIGMWKRQIGYHSLFQGLSKGQFRREVLVGLFIETYHLVRLASNHIAAAAGSANSDFDRTVLARYLSEESDHAHYILRTCEALGYSAVDVHASQPIVGTISLVHMLSEIGRQDTIAYLAALALMESVPRDAVEADEAITMLAIAYDVDRAVFQDARDHLNVDLKMGHGNLLARSLQHCSELSLDRANSIVNLVHDLKHAFDQMHDGILQYYGDISNYVPRLKVDYLSL